MRIGIISAGKVGTVIGSALRAQGHRIIGAYAHSEESLDRLEVMLPGVPVLDPEQIVKCAEMVLLALPDDALGPLVAGLAKLDLWHPGQIVVHTAGRFGVNVLRPAQLAGALCLAVHPAMTFTGTSIDLARLQGCPFAITAPAPYQAIGHALVAEIGGTSVVIAEEHREIYHTALAHGANHLVTLVTQSMRMLESVGIEQPGAYLQALTSAALEGALSSGDSLLTGPIVRADIGTVAGHLNTVERLSGENPDLSDLDFTYKALALATVNRALQRRVLNRDQARELSELLLKQHDFTQYLAGISDTDSGLES